MMAVTVIFSLIYLSVLLNLNESTLLATIKWIPMLIVKSIVLVTNYKSKQSTDFSFVLLGMNLIPFVFTIIPIFMGLNAVWITEIMAFTLFLIPQLGAFALLSMATKSK
jgi:hypothetical protein